MAWNLPGLRLTKTTDLSKEESEAWNEAIIFRGEYIEQMIQLENRVDICISKFLNRQNNQNVFNFLHYHLLGHSSMNFDFKVVSLQQIIRIDFTSSEDYMVYFTLIDKLKALRNCVAHYPVDSKFLGGISFFKLAAKFKVDEASTGVKEKRFIGENRCIEITKKAEKEIESQMKIAFAFLHFVIDVYLPEEEREFAIPAMRIIELYKEIDENLKNNLGVFAIGIPS